MIVLLSGRLGRVGSWNYFTTYEMSLLVNSTTLKIAQERAKRKGYLAERRFLSSWGFSFILTEDMLIKKDGKFVIKFLWT